MAGWFVREINRPEDYKDLRYRMAGPGAEVLRRMGATVVTISGSEIVGALRSGAVDASEWIGPWMDMELGRWIASCASRCRSRSCGFIASSVSRMFLRDA
jgi:TRAP-type mannitol/chloroaromatic compound transport system substrate-binding protein